MSWVSRDLTEKHGLRPLTWRDGLLWRRAARAILVAAIWSAITLWLLSQLYDPGAITILVVAAAGLSGGVLVVHEDATDLPRWPRRSDP